MFILTENNILLDILKPTGREAGDVLSETNTEAHKLAFESLFRTQGEGATPAAARAVAARGLLGCSLAGVFVPVAQVPNLTRAVREREWMKFDHFASHPAGVPERQHHHPVFCRGSGRGARGPASVHHKVWNHWEHNLRRHWILVVSQQLSIFQITK